MSRIRSGGRVAGLWGYLAKFSVARSRFVVLMQCSVTVSPTSLQSCHRMSCRHHKPRFCHTDLCQTSPKPSHATIGPYAQGPNPINKPNRRSLKPTTATSTVLQQSRTTHHECLKPTTVTTLMHIQQTANYRRDKRGWTGADKVRRV